MNGAGIIASAENIPMYTNIVPGEARVPVAAPHKPSLLKAEKSLRFAEISWIKQGKNTIRAMDAGSAKPAFPVKAKRPC